jgi:hypothetical protein
MMHGFSSILNMLHIEVRILCFITLAVDSIKSLFREVFMRIQLPLGRMVSAGGKWILGLTTEGHCLTERIQANFVRG